MGTKLYVGNLSYNTSEARIREVFAEDGREVTSVAIIMDRETGRPRGFAFVEFASEAAAQAAMQALDGQDLDGRTLRITEARERDARGPRPGGFGGGPGGPRPGGFGGGPGGPRPGGFGGGPGGPRPGGFGGGPGAAPSADTRRKRKDGERKDSDRGREDRGGARRRRDDDDAW